MEPLNSEGRAKLKEHLKSRALLQALASVMLQKEDFAGRIATMDLSTPKGVAEAQKLQGQILGVHYAIEQLFAAAEGSENVSSE